MKERRGTLTEITDLGERASSPLFLQEATITMDDGSTLTVEIPDAVSIEVGSVVTEIDRGDGKPIYNWT